MNEQEYINVRDLSNVMHAKMMLGDITISNQPNIDADEYRHVMKVVYKWQDAMFKAVFVEVQE
jgi:hypothetical protein